MSNDVTVFNPAASLPAELAGVFDAGALAGDLSDGAGGGGFQVVSLRGAKWRIKSGGEEVPLVNADGDPVAGIDVVIVKSNRNVSKLYYEKNYSEGDDEAPTCMSVDGIKPDPGCTKPQNKDCATCKWNKWGSRMTEAGKKAKKCSDTRRVAVWMRSMTPEGVDGSEPMLLRIPAASLNDLAAFGTKMAQKNYPYNAIVTRIRFDMNVSYPKLLFSAARPLQDDEPNTVAEMFNSDVVANILSQSEHVVGDTSGEEATEVAEPEVEDSPFEDAAPAPAQEPEPEPAPEPVKKKASKKKAAKKPTPEPEPEPTPEPAQEAPAAATSDDLDDIIAELENL